jgi:dihydroxyacid dehydratase/phosphogluconate dehydratase
VLAAAGIDYIGARRLHLDVSDDELKARKQAWAPPEPHYHRGYGWMFSQHIRQATDGADFDSLEAGASTPEPAIR